MEPGDENFSKNGDQTALLSTLDVMNIYITLKTEKYTSSATLQEAFTWPDDTLHQKQVLMYFETWKTHSVHF